MEKNKTGKYFKYAIGEIILVVIGILIALQINNWNEIKNSSNKELALLGNLKNDIEADIFNLQRQDSFYTKQEADAELGLELFYKATTIKDIDSVMGLTNARWNELYINQNTYDEMINSGSMYTMKNKELQKKINKYYNMVEAHIEYIRSVNTMQSELFELDTAIFPLNLLISQLKNPRIDLKLIDTSWINNPKSATYLSVDNYLNSNQNINNHYRRVVFKRLLTGANALLDDIDNELEYRN